MAVNLRTKYGPLYDLIDTANIRKNESVFHSYKPKADIGRLIFKELYSRFQSNPAKGATGFYMDDAQEIGILSQCQSLQAMLTLASNFDLTFDDKHIISDDNENLSIREIMDMVIEDVLKRIETSTPDVYLFDASPYDSTSFSVEYSNIEAMTWVVPCFLSTLKYHAHIGETCKWEKQLVSVISYAMKYINDSFIENDGEGKSNALTIGWNFTKDCQEPSLYYSFTVCEYYVDFFTTFEEYLSYKLAEKYGTATDEDKDTYDKHIEVYNQLLKRDDPGYDEKTGKKLARFDEYNELRLRYLEINGGVDGVDGSLYGDLEDKCKRVAHEIWRLCKENLADEFYYNDLHAKLSEEDIAMSTTSDALFNTVYIINIMVDAGLDEDIKRLQELSSDEEEVARLQEEYNDLLEACQMALQKAFRAYDKLKADGKEYIVEQFLVGFNEKFTTHKDLVKDLRKRRMRVFTLMPLLIRTNNVISEYLVQYPQASMRKYLGYILENRYLEKGKKKCRWIWERDGYFSCSNYYYISALGEFYTYYEKYESLYIQHYAENSNQRAAIIAEQMEAMKAPTGDIGKLKRAVQDRDKEIAKLKAQLDGIETPVEDAVAAVAAEQIKRLFPELLSGFLGDVAKEISLGAVTPSERKNSHPELVGSIKELFGAMLSGNMMGALRLEHKMSDEQLADYKSLETDTAVGTDAAASYDLMRRALPELLCEFIFEASKGITVDSIDSTECQDTHVRFVSGMKALMLAMISGNISAALRLDRKSPEEQLAEYKEFAKHVSDDVDESVTQYISAIKNSPDHRSKIFDTNKGD